MSANFSPPFSFEFDFEKYHGLGNDFIFIDAYILEQFSKADSLKNFVQNVCQRRTSVGADGVVFYRFCPESRKTEMLIINSDGSFAANCGNALRCLGLALYRKNFLDGKEPIFVFRLCLSQDLKNSLYEKEFYLLKEGEGFGFLKSITPHSLRVGSQASQVTILLSPPQFLKNWTGQFPISFNCKYKPTKVQLENPHIIFLSKDFQNYFQDEYSHFGHEVQKVENANIGMVTLASQTNVFDLCVYERGVGLTKACGTGAVAAAYALCAAGVVKSLDETVELKMPGGSLFVKKTQLPQDQELGLEFKPKHMAALCAETEFVFSACMRVASA